MQQIRVPVKYQDLDDGQWKFRIEERPILDPHLILQYLFDDANVKIPAEAVRKYWSHHARHGEKWAQTCDNYNRIPVGIFGDSARVTAQYGKVVQVVGIFMNLVLWRPASVRASRFCLFTIGEDELWSIHTLQAVYRRLTWSLNAAYMGKHPEVGPGGEVLPPKLQAKGGQQLTRDSFLFCCTEIRGDWSWHKKVWRFHRTFWTGVQICHHCRALSAGDWGDIYWNLNDDNNWQNSEFDLDEFCQERLPPHGICPLLGLHNFDPSVIRWCLMHVFHLGLLFSANGSSLHLLLSAGYWGDPQHVSRQLLLSKAYQDFKAWCRANRLHCSQPEFRESMLYKKNGDVMLTLKAYNGR